MNFCYLSFFFFFFNNLFECLCLRNKKDFQPAPIFVKLNVEDHTFLLPRSSLLFFAVSAMLSTQCIGLPCLSIYLFRTSFTLFYLFRKFRNSCLFLYSFPKKEFFFLILIQVLTDTIVSFLK